MSAEATSRKQVEDKLVRKASEDLAFRQELLANPKAAISREFGIQLQDDFNIKVVEETANDLILVLPAQAASNKAELTEREMDAVAGGIIIDGSRPAYTAEKSTQISPVKTLNNPGY